MFLIVLEELESLFLTAVPTYRRYIEHTRTKLDESSAFERQRQLGNVVQTEVYEILQRVVPDKILNAL